MRFADRVYKYFFNDGVLTPKACTDRFMARVHQIEMAIIAESARWGDSKRAKPRTKDDDWLPDINGMIANYFPPRTGVVLNQFKSQGWWPNVDPPIMNTRGGHVAAGFSLQMSSSGHDLLHARRHRSASAGTSGPTAAAVTLVAENAAKRVLVPTGTSATPGRADAAFDDSAWIERRPAASATSAAPATSSYFSIDLRQPDVQQASQLLHPHPVHDHDRRPCRIYLCCSGCGTTTASSPTSTATEVRRAATSRARPQWNSAATASQSGRGRRGLETFDISSRISALRRGHESAGHPRT